MNKYGESYILATLMIILAIIIAIIYSPRFISESPSSGRVELLKSVIKSLIRSEVASRTRTAFNHLKEYMEGKIKELKIEEILKENNFLSMDPNKQLGKKIMENIYNIKDVNFDVNEEYSIEESTMQEKTLINLTRFKLDLTYTFKDPIAPNLEGSQNYYMELSGVYLSKLNKIKGTIFYKIDTGFDLEDSYGPVKYIEYTIYIFNNTQLEKVAYGFKESSNGHYDISVLIRPEYYIMIYNEKPYKEFGIVLVVSGSRSETLWCVLKVENKEKQG